jgi:pyruvate kinase
MPTVNISSSTLAVDDRPVHRRDAAALLEELITLRETVLNEESARRQSWALLERRAFRLSAQNFAAYLAFRRHDLRRLQLDLMPLGLSSLGPSESRLIPSFDAIVATLQALAQGHPGQHPHARTFFRGERILRRNTIEVFGPARQDRRTRIMVTLPTEAATDRTLVEGRNARP